MGRADTREVVLKRDLRRAVARLNPELPEKAVEEAVLKLTHHDFSRSVIVSNGHRARYQKLPSPPFTEQDKQVAAREVYSFIWNSSTATAYAGARV